MAMASGGRSIEPHFPCSLGSLFPVHRLITGPQANPLGPLLFEQRGSPEHVLSTGCPLEYDFRDHIDKPSSQAKGILELYDDSFLPHDVLLQNFEEDASRKIAATMKSNHILGNRLQGVKCREGTFQLFFPAGRNMDKIGSVLCSSRSVGDFFRCDSNCIADDGGAIPYSQSPSVSHPILQIAAFRGASEWHQDTEAALAARTTYQVHWLTSKVQDKSISFDYKSSSTFKNCVSHVVWNPFLSGETAVVLENGQLCIFDLNSPKNSKLNPQEASLVINSPNQVPKSALKNSRSKKRLRDGFVEVDFSCLESSWWQCDYAWHPQTILLAGSEEVTLIDVRQKHDTKKQAPSHSSILAKCTGGGLASFCSPSSSTDCFGAFAKADYDGMYQFSVASKCRILLFDARQPLIPLLQWEHGMSHEPPGFLLMCPLSTLRPVFREAFKWSSNAGRVILAASWNSGIMHTFCYGPNLPVESSAFDTSMGNSSLCRYDLENALYSWDLPGTLLLSKPSRDSSSIGEVKNGTMLECMLPREKIPTESIAGLCIVSEENNASPSQTNNSNEGFTLLRLTGAGMLLAHKCQASRNLASHHPPQPLTFSDQPPKAIPVKKPTKNCYRFERLPIFLSYIRKGSVWPLFRKDLVTSEDSVMITRHSDICCPKEKLNAATFSNGTTESIDLTRKGGETSPTTCHQIPSVLAQLVKESSNLLSIYEIACKVVWRSLPGDIFEMATERKKILRKQYTGLDFLQLFPSPATISAALVDHENIESDKLEPSEDGRQVSLIGPLLPLPFLLEFQQLLASSAELACNGKCGKLPKPTLSSQMKLMEECKHLGVLLESWNFEKPTKEMDDVVISLDDSTAIWPEASKSSDLQDGDRFFLHRRLECPSAASANAQKNILINNEEGTDAKDLMWISGFMGSRKPLPKSENKESFFDREDFSRFVGIESSAIDLDQDLSLNKLDSDLCPINLTFISSGNNLSSVELLTLNSLGNQFKQWQEDFEPYMSYCESHMSQG